MNERLYQRLFDVLGDNELVSIFMADVELINSLDLNIKDNQGSFRYIPEPELDITKPQALMTIESCAVKAKIGSGIILKGIRQGKIPVYGTMRLVYEIDVLRYKAQVMATQQSSR